MSLPAVRYCVLAHDGLSNLNRAFWCCSAGSMKNDETAPGGERVQSWSTHGSGSQRERSHEAAIG